MDLEPIEGASVTIAGLAPILTDATGSFAARGLPEGTQVLVVTADGYARHEQEVGLRAGTNDGLEIRLERLAGHDPYLEVLQFRGYSFCEIAWYGGTMAPPAFCSSAGTSENQWMVPVDASWRFMVSEVSWQSGIGVAGDSMRLVHAANQSCSKDSPCFGVVFGTHYARLEGEPGKTEVVSHYDPYTDDRGPAYPSESFDLHIFVHWVGMFRDAYSTNPTVDQTCRESMNVVAGAYYKPGCFGWGVSTGIPFDYWLSVFHRMEPEDRGACCPATAYSAMPDR